MNFDLTSAFSGAWSFLMQRFLLFFQWTDQIMIGGVSLLKIGIGLTALTIVIAVVLPVIRVAPVDAGLGQGRPDSAPDPTFLDRYRDYSRARHERDVFDAMYKNERR